VFIVGVEGVGPERALAVIATMQRGFTNKSYAIIRGHRAGSPIVKLNGQSQSLAEAVRTRRRDDRRLKYATVYRRLQRGWSTEQALGLEDPDPRWNHAKQDARRKRVKS
jgi:hypothetical protein